MALVYDSGPMIPYPDARCYCTHKKLQHSQTGTGKCDNCNCPRFRLGTSITEAEAQKMDEAPDPGHDMCVVPDSVAANRGATETIEWDPTKHGPLPHIVGTDWHHFQGDGNLCAGKIGDGSNRICARTRDHEVHSDEKMPDWMRDKQEIPDSGLKDSGQRLQFASGMVRDVDDTKPAFDLVIPEGIPYNELMLTRWAELLRKGAIKYAKRNWEKADSNEELERAKASAFRHFMQWFTGENDEDHAAAVFFNINEVETIRYKQRVKESG